MTTCNHSNAYLSKSLFIRGLQCHKSLYLQKYHPERKGEVSDEQEALFQVGFEVGEYAKQLFPGGIEIPYEENNYAGQVEKTRAEIDKGITTIYEAAFSYDNVFVKVDILHKGPKGWEIYEVKSSTEVKEVHLNDIAVQHYVVKGSGIKFSSASIVHINNEYMKQGTVEVDKLFAKEDVTKEVTVRQRTVKRELAKIRDMLNGEIPVVDIGPHCDDPYECDFKGHCWRHIPENSVFSLRGRGVDKFALYKKGIVRIGDIAIDKLNNGQRMQVEAFLGKRAFIDPKAIKEFLDTIWYPLCFLDFETFQTPLPLYDNTWPYQQVPFQYSLHYLESPDAAMRHYEYLAEPNVDPVDKFLDSLIGQVPDGACVVAYNKTFETRVFNKVAPYFPKYRDSIAVIVQNMRDIAVPFRTKAYYSWLMKGSYSLKDVLPAMVPGLGYDGMEIADGGMAMDAYFAMCASDNPVEIEKIRKALLEYCRLDTLAMVRLYVKLKEISSGCLP